MCVIAICFVEEKFRMKCLNSLFKNYLPCMKKKNKLRTNYIRTGQAEYIVRFVAFVC